MKKNLLCILFLGVHPYVELFNQELKNYHAQFKEMPSSSPVRPKNREEKTVQFQQKIGFKKKKVEYTLALRY